MKKILIFLCTSLVIFVVSIGIYFKVKNNNLEEEGFIDIYYKPRRVFHFRSYKINLYGNIRLKCVEGNLSTGISLRKREIFWVSKLQKNDILIKNSNSLRITVIRNSDTLLSVVPEMAE